jgi:hypothetical protein
MRTQGAGQAMKSGPSRKHRWSVLNCDEVEICDERIQAVIDTGASVSIFSRAWLAKYGLERHVQPAPKTTIDVADGQQHGGDRQAAECAHLARGAHHLEDALVTDALSYDVLLGIDWLVPLGATIDLAKRAGAGEPQGGPGLRQRLYQPLRHQQQQQCRGEQW